LKKTKTAQSRKMQTKIKEISFQSFEMFWCASEDLGRIGSLKILWVVLSMLGGNKLSLFRIIIMTSLIMNDDNSRIDQLRSIPSFSFKFH